jgi:hypothetical protein
MFIVISLKNLTKAEKPQKIAPSIFIAQNIAHWGSEQTNALIHNRSFGHSWNLKVLCCVHNSPPLDLILSYLIQSVAYIFKI